MLWGGTHGAELEDDLASYTLTTYFMSKSMIHIVFPLIFIRPIANSLYYSSSY